MIYRLDDLLHRYAEWCYPLWRPLCDEADRRMRGDRRDRWHR